MSILNLFIDFLNKILDIRILGLTLFDLLLIFTILIFAMRLIYEMIGVSNKNNNKGEKKKK